MNLAKFQNIRSTHRILGFLHTNYEQIKKEIKKKFIYNTIKGFQYLEISLTKEKKSLSLKITKYCYKKDKEDK